MADVAQAGGMSPDVLNTLIFMLAGAVRTL